MFVDYISPLLRPPLRYNESTGAIRVGDFKLLRNVQLQPIYEVPKGNNYSLDGMTHYLNMSYVDYLFNISADPSELHDLKDEQPEVFHELSRALDQ